MDFVVVHDKHFEQTARMALAFILPNSEYDAKKMHE
jgi:predicted molibdopterin-dependent oxidoreductase YjgC